MSFKFSLSALPARVGWALMITALCVLLGLFVLRQFIIGALSNPHTFISKPELIAATRQFPNSSRLQGLLAEAELVEVSDPEEAAVRAEAAAARAVALSPNKYEHRLVLAAARELRGDAAGAEEAMRSALARAPNNTQVHWRLANLLVRTGKLNEALDHFRAAVSADPRLTPEMLDLIWDVSNGQVQALESAIGNSAAARLKLAAFLLQKKRDAEAASVFRRIDRQARSAAPESADFLSALISAGQLELARELWIDVVSGGPTEGNRQSLPLVWNGGFETDPLAKLNHFDWSIGSNNFAQVSIDRSLAHTGSRSLKIAFAGLDTTRLDEEVNQFILVEPGASYRLECYVKTKDLITPEGPRVVLNAINSTVATSLGASNAAASGTNDWQPLTVDFTVPRDAKIIKLNLKRTPKFSYDDPTQGVVWFDDFNLTKRGGGK